MFYLYKMLPSDLTCPVINILFSTSTRFLLLIVFQILDYNMLYFYGLDKTTAPLPKKERKDENK